MSRTKSLPKTGTPRPHPVPAGRLPRSRLAKPSTNPKELSRFTRLSEALRQHPKLVSSLLLTNFSIPTLIALVEDVSAATAGVAVGQAITAKDLQAEVSRILQNSTGKAEAEVQKEVVGAVRSYVSAE